MKQDPNVTLSLRQADILKSLAQDEELCKAGGCVPDLQDVTTHVPKYDDYNG